MNEKTKLLIKQNYNQCGYRRANGRWVGGDHQVVIETTVGNLAYVKTETKTVWHRRHAWCGMNSTHILGVPRHWRVSVCDRGLAVVDGLLTLAAYITPRSKRLRAACENCFEGVWVKQGRGVSVYAQHGLLVRGSTGWFHVETVDISASALAGVVTRRDSRIAAEARAKERARTELLTRYDDVNVSATIADAYCVQLCQTGIMDWLVKHGFVTDGKPVTEVPVPKLWRAAVETGDSLQTVERVIRTALIRHNHETTQASVPAPDAGTTKV